MSNKNNNLNYQKQQTIKNSDDSFKAMAEKVEKVSPIGTTSGMGSDNYYHNEGKAYNSYKEAVKDVAERNNIK